MSEDPQLSHRSADRRGRIAAVLEQQFDRCNEAAERLLASMAGERADYFNMPIAIALLRTSGQLGAAIARLEAIRSAERAAARPKNAEIDGSIPQRSCASSGDAR